MYTNLLVLLAVVTLASGQPRKCDQTPPNTSMPPAEDKGLFVLTVEHSTIEHGQLMFNPLQTYLLTINSVNASRPFRWFMVTAEDPEVDNNLYNFGHKSVDVGSLKMLNTGLSQHSEKCANTVEIFDNTPKTHIEIHWKSPEETDKVRIRAMVAENKETWYIGENLTVTLVKQLQHSVDSPPIEPKPYCKLCSEARYEVIFTGAWSRLKHYRHYPTKPDENGYSHLVGASHDYNYVMWSPDSPASPGMQQLAEYTNTDLLEREIIDNMSEQNGTRTLIRGKRRHHPHMSDPSYALFRVDRVHHLFSVAIGMTPSPDWFLGTSRFELCNGDQWLDTHKMPLFPWDAGTMDGVSYESPRSVTQPVNNIQRVEVGSFNEESPFYQVNLNDLQPFAYLEVNRLDVYQWDPSECEDIAQYNQEPSQDEPQDGPRIAESRQSGQNGQSGQNCPGQWGEWSPCTPYEGSCGRGGQTRARETERHDYSDLNEDTAMPPPNASCPIEDNSSPIEFRICYVDC